MLTELLLAGCIVGVFYGAKKIDDYRAKHPPGQNQPKTPPQKAQETAKSIDDECEAVRSVCGSFGCRFRAEHVRFFDSPDWESEYLVGDRRYVSTQTLTKEKLGSEDKPFGLRCDRISRFRDAYGNSVVDLVQDVPCFDSGDRQYDSAHELYFFHSGGQSHALYCGSGYRIASLTLFENISPQSILLRNILNKNGFPV